MLLYEKDDKTEFKKTIRFFSFCIIVIFAMILFRLWYLQIIQEKKFKALSENNRIRIRNITNTRGIILDRKGRIMVDNYPCFVLSIILEDVPNLTEIIKKLSILLNLDSEKLKNTIHESKGNHPFKPITLKKDLTRKDIAIIETNKPYLPGIIIEVEPKRFYLFDNLAAHITGYIGKISKSQLKTTAYAQYKPIDTVGKYGIEYEFESLLRGKDGGEKIEVDAAGREVRILGEVQPFPGKNIFLTIDLDIQMTVERLLTKKKGCAIVINPNNGEILALASSPFFNPNMFSRTISRKEWEELISDPHSPLENKAIQGQYPPGSIYKIITAIAGLEEGIITPNTEIFCKGYIKFGRRNFRCWKKLGHGKVNLHKALVESCDIYFYQVGKQLGIDRLAYYSSAFGLGKLTGISLPNEKTGLVPSREWKQKKIKSRWQEGETLSVAIGQGFLLVTPIQIANIISSIANGGTLYSPQIVKKIEDQNGTTIKEFEPNEIGKIPAKPKTISLIKEALCGAVNEPLGTGWRAKVTGITIAGKTGTSQVISMPADSHRKTKKEITPFEFRDHAWFAAFAPSVHPEIAVVVIIEHGGHGGTVAAPIAAGIIKESLNILSLN